MAVAYRTKMTISPTQTGRDTAIMLKSDHFLKDLSPKHLRYTNYKKKWVYSTRKKKLLLKMKNWNKKFDWNFGRCKKCESSECCNMKRLRAWAAKKITATRPLEVKTKNSALVAVFLHISMFGQLFILYGLPADANYSACRGKFKWIF